MPDLELTVQFMVRMLLPVPAVVTRPSCHPQPPSAASQALTDPGALKEGKDAIVCFCFPLAAAAG